MITAPIALVAPRVVVEGDLPHGADRAPTHRTTAGRVATVPTTSAGILLFRRTGGGLEVLLGHPGGPFWAKKDLGAWMILKGEVEPGEDPYEVARREFEEETGHEAPDTEPLPLGEVTQRGGKRVIAWALEGHLDPAHAVSNTLQIEWPPRSGRMRTIPEIDRVAWLDPDAARLAINVAQVAFVDRLEDALR